MTTPQQRPAPGTHLSYRIDGTVRSGVVEPYDQRTSNCLFPVRDDIGPLMHMILASEIVPDEPDPPTEPDEAP